MKATLFTLLLVLFLGLGAQATLQGTPTGLQMVHPQSLRMGKKTNVEQFEFSITLENSTEKPIILRSISAPTAVTLATTKFPLSLAPKDHFEVKGRGDGAKIPRGAFRLPIVIHAENQQTTYCVLEGEIITGFDYRPSPAIDLGNFAGDVNWSRSWEIRSLVAGLELGVHAQPNQLVKTSLRCEAPGIYTIFVNPRGPLPNGELLETLEYPVIRNNQQTGVLRLTICGMVTGIRLKSSLTRLSLRPEDFDQQGICRTIIRLTPDHTIRKADTVRTIPSGATLQPLQADEEAARPFNSTLTWESLVKDVTISLPPDIRYKLLPTWQALELHLEIPRRAFRENRRRLRGDIHFQGRAVSPLAIIFNGEL